MRWRNFALVIIEWRCYHSRPFYQCPEDTKSIWTIIFRVLESNSRATMRGALMCLWCKLAKKRSNLGAHKSATFSTLKNCFYNFFSSSCCWPFVSIPHPWLGLKRHTLYESNRSRRSPFGKLHSKIKLYCFFLSSLRFSSFVFFQGAKFGEIYDAKAEIRKLLSMSAEYLHWINSNLKVFMLTANRHDSRNVGN